MGWTLSASVTEFLAAAGPLLEAHPAQNTVLLTVSARIATVGADAFGDGPPLFGWWRADERSPVSGAMVVTPPFPLRLSAMPVHAAAELVGELPSWPGEVAGPPPIAEEFATAWSAQTGGTVHTRLEERLYRLGELAVPSAPGESVRASSEHRDLLVDWIGAFADELNIPHGDPEGVVDSRLDSGSIALWQVDEPVSIAAASQVVAGMARIGPVYTPPQWRGHGYGSASTAAASEDALARGATDVVLFADVANPTSNSIYQKIGFRAIADDVILALQP